MVSRFFQRNCRRHTSVSNVGIFAGTVPPHPYPLPQGEGDAFAGARSHREPRFHWAPPAMFLLHEPLGCRSRRKEANLTGLQSLLPRFRNFGCFRWITNGPYRDGIDWFGKPRCSQPCQGRQKIAQRFIAGNKAPPESPSPARGERNPRAFAASQRRGPIANLLSSLRDFGPSCLRIPPLKGWVIWCRPAGLAALFHQKRQGILL